MMNEFEKTRGGSVDYSLASKFEAAGIRSEETTEKELAANRGNLNEKELGRGNSKEHNIYRSKEPHNSIVSETVKNINEKDVSNGRNHSGNNNKANRPALEKALNEAGILTTEERARVVNQFNKEKSAVVRKIDEIKAHIEEARGSGQDDAVKNWEVRLKKEEDILSAYEEANTSIDSDSGKARLRDLGDYTKERDLQLRGELKGINAAEVKISENTTPRLTPSERISYPQEESVITLTDTNSEITSMEKFPTQETVDNWQEKAIETFENEGGKILEAELEPRPEQEKEKESVAIPPQEKVADEKPEVPAEAVPVEKTENKGETAEERKERILKAIWNPEKASALEARAEKVGALDYVRRGAEVWNKFPIRYKVLLSTGMLISGLGAAAVGSTVATGAITAIGVGMRGASGAGLFVLFEKTLKASAEKGGIERSSGTELRHTAMAAMLSILVVGALPSVARDFASEHLFSSASTEMGTSGHSESVAVAPIVCEVTVQPGDSVWKMAEHGLTTGLGEKFTSLSPEQQTYLIDAVENQITENPEQFGLEDANHIEVGQKINFGSILNDQEFMTNTLAEAKGLSAEEIANIKNYPGEETVGGADTSTPEQETNVDHQELSPTNPEVIAVADELFHNHVNDVFGSKGFFGFGAVDGLKTPNWADPEVGFANKTIEEVVNAKPIVLPGGEQHFGIEDRAATEKMQDYLRKAFDETGIPSENGETVEKYLKRISMESVMYKG